eukprot:c23330_g1_i1 orf=143-997(+)
MMPALLNLLPQRRTVKPVEGEAGESVVFAEDLPKDLTLVRLQESFKGELEPRQQRAWVVSRLFAKSILVLAGLVTILSALLMYGSGLLLIRANHLGRQCLEVQLKAEQSSRKYKFAMVTSTDGATVVPGRSFEGLMELATPNKQSYAKRHGYDFIDASDLIDRDRPPSWSKIVAVRKHLPSYDWVLWNDADSIVTNPAIALEDIINFVVGDTEFDNMQDFIVTEDVTGVNAGTYSRGDFMVHLAGLDDKKRWMKKILQDIEDERNMLNNTGGQRSKSGSNGLLK